MDKALLDTDTLSEVLKRKDRWILAKAQQYLSQHLRFSFSAITAYEIVRGLKTRRATRQLTAFGKVLRTSDVYSVSMRVLMRAADLWAEARSAGQPHNDADLIIAATALEQALTLATGNTAHFSWIRGLSLEDWR